MEWSDEGRRSRMFVPFFLTVSNSKPRMTELLSEEEGSK
jgi:hypothetical protein